MGNASGALLESLQVNSKSRISRLTVSASRLLVLFVSLSTIGYRMSEQRKVACLSVVLPSSSNLKTSSSRTQFNLHVPWRFHLFPISPFFAQIILLFSLSSTICPQTSAMFCDIPILNISLLYNNNIAASFMNAESQAHFIARHCSFKNSQYRFLLNFRLHYRIPMTS